MAVGQGFEPWIPVKVYLLSKQAHSATMRSHHKLGTIYYIYWV